MASSFDIAEQINAQNQWFMQQNALSSQIGVNPMAFGGGMGGFGAGAPFMGSPVMATAPGAARQVPGAFNYGNTMGYGYGAGNRIGSMAMGGIAAAPAIFGLGAGLASMTSSGAWLAPFTNPVSGFMAGRAMGLGLAGSTGVAGLAMLPAMAGAHVVNSMVGGAAQGSAVQTALSGFNFMNTSSRTGMGFSRSDAHAVTSQLRELAYIPELLTSMEELTSMIPKLRASGLMQGITGAREFNTRFKEAITTLRDVSKMLGTSMSEAADFFAHSRSVGMFGQGAVLKNAINSQVVMSATGMNLGQTMQLQQSGANFATAMGSSRRAGASAISNLAAQLGFGVQNGAISQETLQDMTGMVGSEAQAGAAARLLNLSARLAGGPGGRMAIVGAMRLDENGKAVLDQGVMSALSSGAMSLGQLQRLAGRNAGNRRLVEAFVGNEDRLTMQFAEQGGAAAAFGLYGNALGTRDLNKMKILLKMQGANELEIEALEGLFKQQMSGLGYQQQVLSSVRQNTASAVERGAPSAILKRIMTSLGNKITRPFEEAGDEVRHSVGTALERNFDEFLGNVVVSTAEETKKRYIQAFAAGGGEFARLAGRSIPFRGGGPTTLGGYIGNSAVGSWLRGLAYPGSSRLPDQVFRDEAAAYGLSGLDASNPEDVRRLSYLARDAAKTGKFTEGGFGVADFNADEMAGAADAASIYREMALSGKFRGMSNNERIEAFENYLSGNASWRGDKPGMRKALTSLEGRGISRSASIRGLALGAMQHLPSSMRLNYGQTISGDISRSGVVSMKGRAREQMGGVFKPHIAEALEKNPGARDAVLAVLRASGTKNTDELVMAIQDRNLEEANRIAAELRLGVSFDQKSLEIASEAITPAMSNKAAASSALGMAKDAEDAGGALDLQNGLRRQASLAGTAAALAKESGQGNLGKALSEVQMAYDTVASSIGGGEEAARAAYDKVNTAFASLSKVVGNNARAIEALPESAKNFYLRMRGAERTLSTLGRRTTAGEIAAAMGGSEADLRAAMGWTDRESVVLNAETKAKIQGYYGRHGAASVAMAVGEGPTPSQKDQAVINTMKVIAEAIISLTSDDKKKAVASKLLSGLDRPSSNVDWGRY